MNKKNSDEIIVKFDEVTKQYGDLVVLDKLNLEIKKNEMVSIIGPSGSGKSTLANLLFKHLLKNNRKLKLKIIDEVIPEPLGGAHRDPDSIAEDIKHSILKNLKN